VADYGRPEPGRKRKREKMRQRLSLLGILIAMALLRAELASGEVILPEGLALFQLFAPGEVELALVEQSGATVYARLTGEGGPYLLVGAPADQNWPAGLEVTLLDEQAGGATYVVAYLMPGGARPDWGAFGELLLEDGLHALLRTSTGAAGRLARTGVPVRAVSMDPKPLRPAAVEATFPPLTEPDPLIQEMIDQVDSTTVYSYTAGLSGEWPVEIGGSPYTITTRHTYSGEPIQQATQYVGQHLADLGLAVEYHQWVHLPYSNRNVIGELAGLINPDEIFIIGAHLDDKPDPPNLAPGADDNASGSVAVLMAADILTQYDWGCTLRFALWTGEEQGLLGSKAYAQRADNGGEQIAGYLNLDMIGYNSTASLRGIDLYADPSLPESLTLIQLFADVVDAYNLSLVPELIPNGMGSSDHASFWDYGFTAMLAIEDLDDFNPFYHRTDDRLQHLDMGYYTDMVKASVGTFAHMSDCLIRDGVGYLDGHVTDADDGSPIAGAVVTAGGPAGDLIATETDSSGYYTQTLNTGSYTMTVQAPHYLSQAVSDVAILPDQGTTADVSLEPWPRVYLPLLMASG
jgi:hypothetical protein